MLINRGVRSLLEDSQTWHTRLLDGTTPPTNDEFQRMTMELDILRPLLLVLVPVLELELLP
jgi:hypothetical protein